jgi:peptidyl-dipeptidase Dcp
LLSLADFFFFNTIPKGHGHHGMLSDCTYGRLSSTSVLTDFVELPSQLMEHWFEEPEVLKEYARHYETGEPVPDELIHKMKKAKSFNQGFATIEYTACALLDMLLHQVEDYDDFDISAFERTELDRVGMPQGVVMRHRPGHFQHLFASTQYAAGYYGPWQSTILLCLLEGFLIENPLLEFVCLLCF